MKIAGNFKSVFALELFYFAFFFYDETEGRALDATGGFGAGDFDANDAR